MFTKKTIDAIKYMEVGGGILIMFALGLLLGELTEGSLERMDEIVTLFVGGCSVVFGLGVLYMTQFDPRKHSKNVMIILVVASLIVANIAKMLGIFPQGVIGILFSLSSLIVMSFILLGAIRGCNHMKHRGGVCEVPEGFWDRKDYP